MSTRIKTNVFHFHHLRSPRGRAYFDLYRNVRRKLYTPLFFTGAVTLTPNKFNKVVQSIFSPLTPKICASVKLLGNTIFGIVILESEVMLVVKLAQLGKRSDIERMVGEEVAALRVEVMVWVTVTTSTPESVDVELGEVEVGVSVVDEEVAEVG